VQLEVHAVSLRLLRRAGVFVGLAGLVASSTVLVGSGGAGAAPLDEQLVVPSDSAVGVTSSVLDPTKTYLITVRGTFRYGTSNSYADAECSTYNPDSTWQRNRFLLLDPTGDQLDLYVNGQPVDWEANSPDSFGCNTRDHTYRLSYRPLSPGALTFGVHDVPDANPDNSGSLFVRITEERILQTLDVPASSQQGVYSVVSLDPTRTYRLEATGTYSYGTTPSIADAECVSVPPAPGVTNLYGSILTPQDPNDDPLDLYVDEQAREWTPKTAGLTGCDDASHTYSMFHKPAAFGPVRLRINDSNTTDNSGFLRVRIYDLGVASVTGGPQLLPRIEVAETLQIDSQNINGATSMPLLAGQQYLLEANGVYTYGSGTADAECSVWTGNDTTWRRERFLGFGPNMLDLSLNGVGVDWVAVTPDAEQCDSSNHTYRYEFVPADNSSLTARVIDNWYDDNRGVLTLKIFRIREIPVGTVSVDSSSPLGANSVPLLQGQTYRASSSGTYDYWTSKPGTDADAECSQAAFAPYNDPTFQPNRFGDGDLLDLYVGGTEVTWRPRTSPGPCDANHEYDTTFTPRTTGTINFAVRDQAANYADNQGALTVNLFLQLV
jgi:hypothetical protein